VSNHVERRGSGGGGDNPTYLGNCVSHAFNNRNGGKFKVPYWVDSNRIDKLWAGLATTVYQSQDGSQAKIKNNDIAGTAEHVWVLHDPKGGEGNGPATKVAWKMDSSGVYFWNKNGGPGAIDTPANCAPGAVWAPAGINDLLATVGLNSQFRFRPQKIKRE
jgi:hypothetical protein